MPSVPMGRSARAVRSSPPEHRSDKVGARSPFRRASNARLKPSRSVLALSDALAAGQLDYYDHLLDSAEEVSCLLF